jgi:hypothetical protein
MQGWALQQYSNLDVGMRLLWGGGGREGRIDNNGHKAGRWELGSKISWRKYSAPRICEYVVYCMYVSIIMGLPYVSPVCMDLLTIFLL